LTFLAQIVFHDQDGVMNAIFKFVSLCNTDNRNIRFPGLWGESSGYRPRTMYIGSPSTELWHIYLAEWFSG